MIGTRDGVEAEANSGLVRGVPRAKSLGVSRSTTQCRYALGPFIEAIRVLLRTCITRSSVDVRFDNSTNFFPNCVFMSRYRFFPDNGTIGQNFKQVLVAFHAPPFRVDKIPSCHHTLAGGRPTYLS